MRLYNFHAAAGPEEDVVVGVWQLLPKVRHPVPPGFQAHSPWLLHRHALNSYQCTFRVSWPLPQELFAI